MVCPECGGKTEVTHNRSYKDYIRRRRVCKECGHVFSTYETLKPPGERYPMGRPKKASKPKKTSKPKKIKKPKRQPFECRYNCAVVCDGSKECLNCGWKPKGVDLGWEERK